jgi:hypothetical protein
LKTAWWFLKVFLQFSVAGFLTELMRTGKMSRIRPLRIFCWALKWAASSHSVDLHHVAFQISGITILLRHKFLGFCKRFTRKSLNQSLFVAFDFLMPRTDLALIGYNVF